jgi:YfiR/HmsC-like
MTVGRRVSRMLFTRALFLGVLWLSTALNRPSVAADEYSEDSIRAAYLYRFAGYIVWPDTGPPDAPFVIDIIGSPAIARELRRISAGHTINNRSPVVREISSLQDLGNARILYVAEGRGEMLLRLRPEASAAMLLVSAEEDGLRDGSAINFLTVDRTVRFEVSLTAAQRRGLKISADLLGVAVRVQGGRSGE